MRPRAWKADACLLTAALIWGTAFVAQRVGMNHLGPFTFNGVRFLLGGLVLLPWLLRNPAGSDRRNGTWGAGLLLGLILFAGASLQQVGLVSTTAGKAGFITGLYVVLVPVLGCCLGVYPRLGAWASAALAVVGLYLLCVTGPWQISRGDAYVLAGTLFWAAHILVLARVSPGANPYQLAAAQSGVCAVLSLAGAAVLHEPCSLTGLRQALVPIAWGGIFSVGIAYTLQVIAQRDAPPAHAAILLSLETVFAALAGWWLLDEHLSPRALVGCGLMLVAMITSQLAPAAPAPAASSIPASRAKNAGPNAVTTSEPL
jgi:drug/metabolite transporter (DMT)-like permease